LGGTTITTKEKISDLQNLHVKKCKYCILWENNAIAGNTCKMDMQQHNSPKSKVCIELGRAYIGYKGCGNWIFDEARFSIK